MSTSNIYRAPTADLEGESASSSAGAVTRGMLESLRKTKPWVLLIGILLLVGAVIPVLAALGFMIGGVGMGMGMGGEMPGDMGGMGIGFGIGMGVLYLVMAAIYAFLGMNLVKYSSAIGRALQSQSSSDVEAALAAQSSFWKLAGILALIFLVITVLVVLLGGLGAMFAFTAR